MKVLKQTESSASLVKFLEALYSKNMTIEIGGTSERLTRQEFIDNCLNATVDYDEDEGFNASAYNQFLEDAKGLVDRNDPSTDPTVTSIIECQEGNFRKHQPISQSYTIETNTNTTLSLIFLFRLACDEFEKASDIYEVNVEQIFNENGYEINNVGILVPKNGSAQFIEQPNYPDVGSETIATNFKRNAANQDPFWDKFKSNVIKANTNKIGLLVANRGRIYTDFEFDASISPAPTRLINLSQGMPRKLSALASLDSTIVENLKIYKPENSGVVAMPSDITSEQMLASTIIFDRTDGQCFNDIDFDKAIAETCRSNYNDMLAALFKDQDDGIDEEESFKWWWILIVVLVVLVLLIMCILLGRREEKDKELGGPQKDNYIQDDAFTF